MSGNRTILHVDMDAFFASVEQRDRPELRGLPVIVGGDPTKRGVVCAASYEARKFGVRSAMPLSQAKRLCPQGLFVPVRGAAYKQASRQVFRIFEDYTPMIQIVSVDEAFMDISGVLHLWQDDPVRLAEDLRGRIRRETQLTASAGIAPNKFLAKLASDMNKPDGLTRVPRDSDAITAFLAPLDVGRVWGVGDKTRELLLKHAIRTIGDLQNTPLPRLRALVGEAHALHLHELAFGRDERPVHEPDTEKSISAEHTYDRDQADPEVWRKTLLELSETVGRRLRAGGFWATRIQLKIRNPRFETFTRVRKIDPPTQRDMDIHRHALAILQDLAPAWPVRLFGVGAAEFTDTPPQTRSAQLDLFQPPPPPPKSAKLDRIVDQLRVKYGKESVKRARRLPPPPA